MMRILLCAALFAGSLPAQVAPAQTDNDGSVEGAVINEATREPVRKAQVTMVPGNAPPAVTDENGRFVFRNLPAGTYVLHAQHPEFPLIVAGLAATSPLSVTLAAHERKTGLVLTLTPGASISGRVMDEDEKPLAGCSVQSMQFAPGPAGNRLYGTRAATTDDRGEYRIYGLGRGRFYVSAQCSQPLPQAHGLVKRGSEADVPNQKYGTEFYPDSPDPAGASRLMVATGANVTGIDFHMHATSTVTVHGRINGDADAMSLKPRVELVSRDPLLSGLVRYSASLNAQTGEFQIPAVPAGAYMLVASAQDKRHTYEARLPVDIGADPPQPLDVPLIPGGEFTGVIEIEGDPPKPPVEKIHIRLTPLDPEFSGAWPEAKVEQDGTFSLSGVVAGRWCLKTEGVHGYVKSLSVGGQEMRSCAFSVAPGAGGAIRVVVSTKLANLDGMVNGMTPEQANGVLLILVSEDPETSQPRTMRASADGHFSTSGIAPGRYYLYAAIGNEAVALQQSPRALQALEGRSARVDLEAGGRATAQVDLLSGDEVRQALQESE